MTFLRACVTTLAVVGLFGCGDDSDDVIPPPDAATDSGGSDAGVDASVRMLCDPPGDPDPGACAAETTDYAPGLSDDWPECVSDDGFYHRIEPTISSIARVEAFEEIAALLFDPTTDASTDDFLTARTLYQEDQGLGSRVSRRYDPHFTVPDGTDCTMPTVAAMFPDYCVGPAILEPTILDALNAGIAGTEPRTSAATVEAALLWFFYVSAYKESFTCTTTAKDCDSSYAYYTGGEEARCGIGLARYVNEVDPYAHDRAWDGLLAVRCWRDLDSAEVATDVERRERARDQYDRAVLDGVAAIVRDRLDRFEAAAGDEQAYYWAFVTTLGPALDRAMEAASPTDAQALRDQLAETDPGAVDAAAARAALDAVFSCP